MRHAQHVRRLSHSRLTVNSESSIFLGMSHRHAASERAAIELALIGVTSHSVADILCS